MVLPTRSRTWVGATGGRQHHSRPGLVLKETYIGTIDSAMPEKTHAEGPWYSATERAEKPPRRKRCWDDYNPVHVAAGRLERFPVQGALDSARSGAEMADRGEGHHNLLPDALAACQIGGASCKSKFLFQSLLRLVRVGWRAGGACAFAGVGRGSHSFTFR